MKVNRNAPCPCGSGKKSKHCCGSAREATSQSKWSTLGLYAVAAMAAAGLVLSIINLSQERTENAGRVWSAEHGHWHGPDGSHLGAPPPMPSAVPSGPAPAGKVWSPEHGHYH